MNWSRWGALPDHALLDASAAHRMLEHPMDLQQRDEARRRVEARARIAVQVEAARARARARASRRGSV